MLRWYLLKVLYFKQCSIDLNVSSLCRAVVVSPKMHVTTSLARQAFQPAFGSIISCSNRKGAA